MKHVFLSFASSDIMGALERVHSEVEALDLFDEIYCFDETDLDEDFITATKDRLVHGTRGFGYWCWKPQIILQV